jgi:A/G-specific adenine glycosylase
MLQQTQVKTVIPYFNAFIKKYPTLQKLSLATEDEILASWSGLGFYRRAKNIFAAKEIIKKNHSNKFPSQFDSIIKLPGIGRSTAGALMSLAFLVPQPILDGNVKRVISRLIRKNIAALKEKDLWELSTKLVNSEDCFSYTQGIMDLGATVCTKANPRCNACPLSKNCLSAFEVPQHVNVKKTKSKKIILMSFALVQTKKSLLLTKNDADSIWSSLWIPFENSKMQSHANKLELTSNEKFRHELTHRSLDLDVNIYFSTKEFRLDTNQKYEWIKKDRIEDYGMPKPITKLIQQL